MIMETGSQEMYEIRCFAVQILSIGISIRKTWTRMDGYAPTEKPSAQLIGTGRLHLKIYKLNGLISELIRKETIILWRLLFL
ncbi:MAG TPA: hypothetical protein DCS05_09065, partial [Nitrospiraceae bacterium]|nr:hypothetical protein [Nitrospiraceae bacterium]